MSVCREAASKPWARRRSEPRCSLVTHVMAEPLNYRRTQHASGRCLMYAPARIARGSRDGTSRRETAERGRPRMVRMAYRELPHQGRQDRGGGPRGVGGAHRPSWSQAASRPCASRVRRRCAPAGQRGLATMTYTSSDQRRLEILLMAHDQDFLQRGPKQVRHLEHSQTRVPGHIPDTSSVQNR